MENNQSEYNAAMTEGTKKRIIALAGENFLKQLMLKLSESSGWKNPWTITSKAAGQWISYPTHPGGGYWVDCTRSDEETFEGKIYVKLGSEDYVCIPFTS